MTTEFHISCFSECTLSADHYNMTVDNSSELMDTLRTTGLMVVRVCT